MLSRNPVNYVSVFTCTETRAAVPSYSFLDQQRFHKLSFFLLGFHQLHALVSEWALIY